MSEPHDHYDGIRYSESINSEQDTRKIRNFCYTMFYALYSKDNPNLTTQEITDMLIQYGVDSYNKECETQCKDINEICNDFQDSYPEQTDTDVEMMVMDHGFQELIKQKYGVDNAHDFIKKCGDKYKDILVEMNNESKE